MFNRPSKRVTEGMLVKLLYYILHIQGHQQCSVWWTCGYSTSSVLTASPGSQDPSSKGLSGKPVSGGSGCFSTVFPALLVCCTSLLEAPGSPCGGCSPLAAREISPSQINHAGKQSLSVALSCVVWITATNPANIIPEWLCFALGEEQRLGLLLYRCC